MRGPKAATRKITLRVTDEELKDLRKNALRFTHGNVSDYLRRSIHRNPGTMEGNIARYLIFTH